MAATNRDQILIIINHLHTTTRLHHVVDEDKTLQGCFHEAGRALVPLRQALQEARPDATQSNLKLLGECSTKAEMSKLLLEAVSQAPRPSRFEAYEQAVLRCSNGRTIESLVIGMMADVCGLAEELAIQDKVSELREAIEKLSKMDPSLPKEQSGNAFSHYGSGDQFNAPGGTQNISKGPGNHFPGAAFYAPMNFGGTSGTGQ